MIVLFTLPGSAFKSVKTFPHTDLIVHAIFYFIQTVLLIQAVIQYNKMNDSALRLRYLLLIPVVMGLLIEGIQDLFITNRYWDVLDIMANIVGVLLALVLARTKLFRRLMLHQWKI